MKFILFFYIFICTQMVFALNNVNYTIGLGGFFQDINKDANKDDATKTFAGAMYSQIHAAIAGKLTSNVELELTSNYTPIGVKLNDNAAKGKVFISGIGPRFYISRFSFMIYPGAMIYTIKGNGGTISLNNGLGTSTFVLPSESSSSKSIIMGSTFSIDLAMYRIDIGAISTAPLGVRRTFHLLTQLNVRF